MSDQLTERGYSFFLVVEDVEQLQQADHLQGLNRKLRRIEQLYRSTPLLGGGEDLDQKSDPAGIDPWNLAEVEHNARIAAAHEIGQRVPETIYGVAQIQPAAQLDQLDLAQTAKFDVQIGLTSNDRETSTA